MWVRLPLFPIIRQPNHIILDFYTNNTVENNSYWVFSFVEIIQPKTIYENSKRLGDSKYQLVSHSPLLNQKLINNLVNQEATKPKYFNLNTWYNLININFLRKEKLYTKLKYSRSPAFDIVSGGAAAILAGLLGFLVSEKFGMELVDSGDFYYLWMYLVFIAFSVRPLLIVAESNKSVLSTFSLRRVYKFYITIIINFLKFFK